MYKIIIFIILSTLLAPKANAESETKGKEIHVGVVLGLSGHAAYHGDAIRKGIEIASQTL